MLVAMFEGAGEILLFQTSGGEPIGTEEYFEEGGRDKEDYDLNLVEFPIMITAALKAEPDRVHR